MNGDIERIKRLVSRDEVLNEDDCEALFYAVKDGYSSCINYLLEHKAKPDLQKEHGRAALIFATMVGDPRCVRSIIQDNDDPDIRKEHGRRTLFLAIKYRQPACAKCLWDFITFVDFSDRERIQAMLYALAFPVNFEMLMDLVSYGLDPNIRLGKSQTAIFLAIQAEHVTCVRHLLSYGADIFLEDSDGLKALDLVCQRNTGELKSNNR